MHISTILIFWKNILTSLVILVHNLSTCQYFKFFDYLSFYNVWCIPYSQELDLGIASHISLVLDCCKVCSSTAFLLIHTWQDIWTRQSMHSIHHPLAGTKDWSKYKMPKSVLNVMKECTYRVYSYDNTYWHDSSWLIVFDIVNEVL